MMNQTSPRRRSLVQRGFSMMDVLMTLGVIAIIGGLVAAPVQQAVAGYRLNAAAATVASELKTARSLAMTRGSVVEVNFNPQTRTLQVTDLADTDNPTRTTKVLCEGVGFGSGSANTIRFFPRGFVAGGTVTLENQYGDRMYVVTESSGRSNVTRTYPSGS